MSYTITWKRGGPWFHYAGTVTDADVLRSMEEMLAHPDFPYMRYYIATTAPDVDLSGVTTDAMHDVAELHQRGSEINPHIRGIAVSRTTLGKGLTAIYWNWHQANGGRWTLDIVTSEAEALARAAEALDEA